jgi:hypothetical protein
MLPPSLFVAVLSKFDDLSELSGWDGERKGFQMKGDQLHG